MKLATTKTLLQDINAGRVDQKHRLGLAISKPSIEVDDRDAMERVGDELVRLIETMQIMSKTQADNVASILKVISDSISKPKEIIPDTRIKEWDIKVTSRDKNGMIDAAKLTAKVAKNG
jgi:hypothetical protein